jgi:hypothetical protein
MKWLLVPVLFVSCGSEASEPNVFDPTLHPFVGEFITDAIAADVYVDPLRVKGLGSITFGATGSATSIGVCRTSVYPDGVISLEIVIDPVYFMQVDHCTQKALMYHELGHCLLGLGHSTSEDSVMYPSITPDPTMSCAPTDEKIRVMFLDAKHM